MKSDRPRRFSHDLLYLALRVGIPCFGLLPLRLLQHLGATIGALSFRFSNRERKRAEAHLEIAFPDFSVIERQHIVRDCALHLGRCMGEIAWLLRVSTNEAMRAITTDGVEHITSPLENGTGVIMVTGHCGNWEIIAPALHSYGLSALSVARKIYDPRLDRIGIEFRQKFANETIPRGFRTGHTITKALKEGRLVAMLIDQDIANVPGVFTPFFGRLAWTPSGAAALSLRTGCRIVPVFAHRRSNGHHHVDVLPPIPEPDSSLTSEEKISALTASASQAIEAQIRRFPEQWVWIHRRWRTRPPEEQAIS
ncbi:MAG: lysophospholipid acyltransferase family protein [bacterium]|nr:lysophospholipid acyltransferase family protein [bacterium]